jgi:hypothetical protein
MAKMEVDWDFIVRILETAAKPTRQSIIEAIREMAELGQLPEEAIEAFGRSKNLHGINFWDLLEQAHDGNSQDEQGEVDAIGAWLGMVNSLLED